MIEQEKINWSAEQIGLWINNTRSLYNRKIRIFKSLEKRKDKDIYDPEIAKLAFNFLTTDVRRQLNREEKENILYMIGTTMPPAASTIVNEELLMEFEAWYNEEKEMRAS